MEKQGQTAQGSRCGLFSVTNMRAVSPVVRTVKASTPKRTDAQGGELEVLHETIATCERCDRLRAYCRNLGVVKRAAYRDEEYWANPVPGFGDPKARIHIFLASHQGPTAPTEPVVHSPEMEQVIPYCMNLALPVSPWERIAAMA